MDAIVLSRTPYMIDFQLEAPDGTRITPSSGGMGANSQFVMSRYASYYRCALPVLPAGPDGSHEGVWHAVLKVGRTTAGGASTHGNPNSTFNGPIVPYEFVAHTYSALTFSASVTQKSFEIGAVAQISATLLEYDTVPRGRAKVWAEIRLPNGADDIISLSEHGPGNNYAASYALSSAGVYTFRVRASGETMRGTPFEREQTLTAVAVPGGDHWNPNDPKRDPICELLDCLRNGGINEEFIRRMKELGVDIKSLLKCLEIKCRGNAAAIETRGKTAVSTTGNLNLTAFSQDQLSELAAAVLKSINKED
jgi:hypothetical protein